MKQLLPIHARPREDQSTLPHLNKDLIGAYFTPALEPAWASV
jgi:hypothetical protein